MSTTLVVVTGVSGAGKSTAVNALEDLGFFCVDNLPTPVVKSTIDSLVAARVSRIALGVDVRVRGFLDDAARVLDSLPEPGNLELAVLFLDASDEALLRRFSSTRRPHPLSTTLEPGSEGGASAVIDGIRAERGLLAALRARATVVIDTTRLSVHELRRAVISSFGPSGGRVPRLRTRVLSFGYKFGSPVDADLLFDVRFLKNPYFEPALKDHPGTAPEVRSYVLAADGAAEYLEELERLLVFCLPRFEREGRSYLTVGIGCTGGRHRSVVVAEEITARLRDKLGLRVDAVHRDVDRVNLTGPDADPDHAGPPPSRGGTKS
jgi:UPF0042 nucleotide-binding protein